MVMKSFKDYLVEETKEVAFVFGRFNPPTSGHEKVFNKLKEISKGSQYRVYASQSQDAKRNPLDFKSKIKVLRKMFPRHARSIMSDKGIRTAMDVASSLYDQGFRKVTMVVGQDRVTEFEKLLNKYNGVDGRHGFYNFEGGVRVVSAGQRDPDADDVSGMSASKMRAAATDNDIKTFAKGVPSSYKDVTGLFNQLRNAMGLKESRSFRTHVQLEKVSDTREKFIEGILFNVGDEVVISESKELGVIKALGPNFVTVELDKNEIKRFWIDQIQHAEEILIEANDYYDITADEADAIVKKYKLRRIIGKANMPSKERRPLIGLLYATDDESLQITNDGSGWRVTYTNSAAQAAVKKMVG